MSKRDSNEQPLKAAISDFLKIYGLEERYTEAELVNRWNEIMGPAIARKTRSLKLRGSTLIVRLDSGVLKEEFSYAKPRIASLLNEAMGKEIVREVEIY